MTHSLNRPTGGTVGSRLLGLVGATVLLVALVLLVKALLGLRQQADLPPATAPVMNVEVQTVTTRPQVADVVTLPAVIEPSLKVIVSAEVSGRAEEVCCPEGTRRSAGDVIISLNTDLLQAEYDRAKAQAELDRSRYQRIQNLYDQGAATSDELDGSRAQMEISRALTEAAKARLDRASIAAPITGVLDRIPVKVGEYVDAGAKVAEMVDVDTVKAVVQVPEREVGYFAVGDRAEVLPLVHPGDAPITGTVTYVSQQADEMTRTSRLEISLDNAEGHFHAGGIVQATLTRRMLTDVVLIPLAAVIPLEEGKAVYVVEDAPAPVEGANGVARRREVTLGFIRGREVQVLSGLAAGDRLIVKGHRYVGPGQPVRWTAGE
jgi:membrane fusion protein (multidrug efflux system)